jgi:hypothetical protein
MKPIIIVLLVIAMIGCKPKKENVYYLNPVIEKEIYKHMKSEYTEHYFKPKEKALIGLFVELKDSDTTLVTIEKIGSYSILAEVLEVYEPTFIQTNDTLAIAFFLYL